MLPSLHLEIERWKFNDKYGVWVSTHGRIRNQDGKEYRQKITTGGYMFIRKRIGGNTNQSSLFVHRIILETWKPCKNMENLTIDHINHNKRDNSLKNLEWVSKEENQKRAGNDFEQVLIEDIIQDNTPYVYINGKNYTYAEFENFVNTLNITPLEKERMRSKVINMKNMKHTRMTYCGYTFKPPITAIASTLITDFYIKVNGEAITKKEFNILCHAIPLDIRADFITKVDTFKRSNKEQLKMHNMVFSKV